MQGYVFYLGLESYDLVTLSGFLYFWGFAFLAATTLVAIFKTENDNENDSSGDDGGEPEADLGGNSIHILDFNFLAAFLGISLSWQHRH